MTQPVAESLPMPLPLRRRRSQLERTITGPALWRGILAVVVFIAVWEIGARSADLFGVRIPFLGLLPPGTLPSIFTGAAIGMGITWEVVLAAEMISGGGTQAAGGLGFFIWNSYLGGSLTQIVVGMISIGIAGYLSSSAIRFLGSRLMPWQRSH